MSSEYMHVQLILLASIVIITPNGSVFFSRVA